MFKRIFVVSVSALALGLIISSAAGIGSVLADPGTLEPYEEESLLFIREEEKLARDTYLTLYDVWGMSIHSTIAESEQNHMDAVKTLLDRYGLDDPASDQIGVFQNDFLQEKYDQLVASGKESQENALLAGIEIEELDITDLTNRIANTDNGDIKKVFGNLLDGSENHLRAFVARYEKLTGETYVPRFLDAELYEAIINAESDSGSRSGQLDTAVASSGTGDGKYQYRYTYQYRYVEKEYSAGLQLRGTKR